MKHRILLSAVLAAVLCSAALPASAFFFDREEEVPAVAPLVKNGLAAEGIAFSAEDFVVQSGGLGLTGIRIDSLPELELGALTLGGQPVGVGDVVDLAAVDGLRFASYIRPADAEAAFTFTPLFSDGQLGEPVTAQMYLLAQSNEAPVAEHLELSTYKNVAVTARFSAVDPEGDLLSYQLIKKPARGEVTIGEDGVFVYTPYENKTGRDSFTYIAIDAVGNASDPAKVKVTIEKADTQVTYADLAGDPVHRDAIRLAEEGILVGEQVGGDWFFRPEQEVSRSAFLAMMMQAVGADTLEGVERTGFADDAAIQTWAKPYVSSALKAGVIQGSLTADGQAVFRGTDTITGAEAAVMLDRALQVTDVTVMASENAAPAWAAQSAANLASCGMLTREELSAPVTRGEAAGLLCRALELLESREEGWL